MRQKRIIPRITPALILIIIGLILLIISLVSVLVNFSDIEPGVPRLPGSISKLDQNSAVYGPAAIAEISQMHGQDFGMDNGAVGRYGQSDQVVIWIASFSSIQVAEQLVSSMESRIAAGGSPFTPTGVTQDRHRSIYLLDGMGQKHIYFQSGSMVIWISAHPAIANQAFQQVLVEYP